MRSPQLLWLKAHVLAKKIARVSQALAKHEISRYPSFLETFEQRYAASVGRRYGLSFCNGTSAIEAALFAANVQPGDEVIVPSCTFHASIDPILNAGALPVFADVETTSLTIDPVEVAKKLTHKTKAIIAVHVWGIPADITRLRQVLVGKSVALIEDVSHAHGARYDGRPCGAWGEFGVFSLQGSKAIAAGEGGIVVTDSWESYIRMSAWGHFDRHSQHFATIGLEDFVATGVGYKRRMAPLGALLADVDLDHLDTYNQIKQKNVEILDQALASIDGIEIVQTAETAERGGFYQGYPIRVVHPGVTAEAALAVLTQAGIQASAYPFVLHHQLPVLTDLVFRQALMAQQSPPQPVASPACLPVTETLKTHLILLAPRYLLELDCNLLTKLKSVLAGISTQATSSRPQTLKKPVSV
ncbi:MAG: aminotransferase class I/II-fold pyridoxal phosphate-dependent enzyme [Leptolyngbya sp. SIO1D8]|nr:aminotransferase class I/II-fold pyridoxal phosphate-dependent enzyme [Leptolyngbya sp. SIO1D8]